MPFTYKKRQLHGNLAYRLSQKFEIASVYSADALSNLPHSNLHQITNPQYFAFENDLEFGIDFPQPF
jgi:hypothetical protein